MYTNKSERERCKYLKYRKRITLSYSVQVNSVLGISAVPGAHSAPAGTNWRNTWSTAATA